MSEEEKKAIIELNHYINITAYWKQEEYTNNEIDNYIKILLSLINKQQKEIGLLRELLYMIRQETRYNTISFENNYYRPIKNVTKQQIYESYNIIRTLVKGNYVLLDNREAIDSIVGKE